MNEQPSGGLMQALAPIAARRPVHLIVSKGATEGTLHVVCQPLRVGNDEDPEIARGFSVEDTPAELDGSLPGQVATIWVPAHQSLQSVLDQAAAHAEQARLATLRKQKEGGKGKKDGAGAASAQTTLTPPPADAAAPSAAVAPAPEPTHAPETGAEAAVTAPEPASPVPAAPAETAPAQAAAADGISSLFE